MEGKNRAQSSVDSSGRERERFLFLTQLLFNTTAPCNRHSAQMENDPLLIEIEVAAQELAAEHRLYMPVHEKKVRAVVAVVAPPNQALDTINV